MITPEKYKEIEDLAAQITDELINYITKDIIRRVTEAGQFTNTAAYDLWLLETYGLNDAKLIAEIAEKLKITEAELSKMIEDAGEFTYIQDYKLLGVTPPPVSERTALYQLINGIKTVSEGDYENITRTIGFVGPDGFFSPLTRAYHKASDFAFEQVASGATDYSTAVVQATRNLLNYGIRTVDYESGITIEAGAAVRRNVMSSIGNLANAVAEENHDDLKCDGWEISAHAMSAPDHEDIQGKRYTDAEFEALNMSLQRPIGTLNCGHMAYPVYLGKTPPVESPSTLKEWKEKNHEGINYEGKHYTLYEATQKQRSMERALRKNNYKIELEKKTAEYTGDKKKLNSLQTKKKEMIRTYNNFSKEAGLKPQYNRFRI